MRQVLASMIAFSTACGLLGGAGRAPTLKIDTPYVDTANAPIPDSSRLERTIDIPSGTVTRGTVEAVIRHGRPDDLQVDLTSPSGTTVNVVGRLADGNGIYRYAIPLLALQGQPATGPWRLTVTDGASGQTGTLIVWGIGFEP